MVAQPMAAVAKQAVHVTIPAGVFPGQTFYVQHNGQTVQITCPPGAAPGSTIAVNI